MAKKKPQANIKPPAFGMDAVEPSPQASVQELLAATPVQPSPEPSVPAAEPVAELVERREIVEEVLPVPAAVPMFAPPDVRWWRVSLEGCKVRVVDPVREVASFQDYLDVEAVTEWEACEKFAAYNGIPVKRDPLTGHRMLASKFRPHAVQVPAPKAA